MSIESWQSDKEDSSSDDSEQAKTRASQRTNFESLSKRPAAPRAPIEAILATNKAAEAAVESADDDEEEEDSKPTDKPAPTPAEATEASPPAEAEAEETAGYVVEHSVAEAAEGEVALHAPEAPAADAVAEHSDAEMDDDDAPLVPPPLSPVSGLPERPAPVAVEADDTSAAHGVTPSPSFGNLGASWRTSSSVSSETSTSASRTWLGSAESSGSVVVETKEQKRGNGKLQLLAAFLAGYVVKDYLSRKKNKLREEQFKEALDKRNKQDVYATAERQRLERTVYEQADSLEKYRRAEKADNAPAARFERPLEAAKPKPETAPAEVLDPEQMFDQQGNQIILQPGWRAERSAGGYITVLDERNRVIHNAVRYGREFQMDQKREQLAADLFGVDKGTTAALGSGSLADGSQAAPPQLSSPTDTAAPYFPPSYPQGQADLSHRLPEPRNPLASTISSPWLWVAMAFLLIIYFVAALA